MIRITFSLLLVLLLSACATQKHQRDLLTTTLYDYQGAIRWNNFSAAVGFIDPEVLKKKPVTDLEMERYEQIQITGYYVKGNETDLENGIVTQVVELSVINRHTQTERRVIDNQRWRFEPEGRRWLLTSGLPDVTASR